MRRWILGIGLLASGLLFALGLAHYFSSPREEDQTRGAHVAAKSVELAAKTAIHAADAAVDAPLPTAAAQADEATRGLSQQPWRISPRMIRLDGQVIELHPIASSGFADEAVFRFGSAAGARPPAHGFAPFAGDAAHGFAPVAGVADDVGRGVGATAGFADDIGRGVGAAAGLADDVGRGVACAAGAMKVLGTAIKSILAAVCGGAAAVFTIGRKKPQGS